MNEILEKLIQWCADSNYGVDVAIHGRMGSIWLTLTLTYTRWNKDKQALETVSLQHSFYIPNGVLCVENWRRGQNDRELEEFLKEANRELKGETT